MSTETHSQSSMDSSWRTAHVALRQSRPQLHLNVYALVTTKRTLRADEALRFNLLARVATGWRHSLACGCSIGTKIQYSQVFVVHAPDSRQQLCAFHAYLYIERHDVVRPYSAVIYTYLQYFTLVTLYVLYHDWFEARDFKLKVCYKGRPGLIYHCKTPSPKSLIT